MDSLWPAPTKEKHDAYMLKMLKGDNEANTLLHVQWQRWARRVRYCGEPDFHAIARDGNTFLLRHNMIRKFSWAIPNEAALDKIASYGRVLEVGSGTGYWAHLLKLKGVDVVAVDTMEESIASPPRWFPDTTKADGATYLKEHGGCPDRALFMCWPRFGADVLDAYRGDALLVISEAATWQVDDEDGWNIVQEIEIPLWPGMHDRLYVYERSLNTRDS